MNFPTLLILLLLQVACYAQSTRQEKPTTVNQLTVVTKNETGNPILLSTDENYFNLDNYKSVISKKTDTLTISTSRLTYYYLSHKNTYPDTVLAGPGDTIKLYAKANKIDAQVVSKNSYPKVVADFFINKAKTTLSYKVDSLSRLFYWVDYKAEPLQGQNDYSKLISHRIRVNRKALAENISGFNALLALMEQNYEQSKVSLADKRIKGIPEIVPVINDKLQIDYFNALRQLQMLSNSPIVKEKMCSGVFINPELLRSPYSSSIMFTYLMKHVIQQKPDFSRLKEYVNYKEAYDHVGDYVKDDSLVKYAKFLSIGRMAEYEEPLTELNKRYKNFVSLYKDNRLNELLLAKLSPILNRYQEKADDLVFTDTKGQTQTLKDLLKNASGKLVYVDFWASWCIPCRDAMPDSKKLRAEYEKKNVWFLYLSTDRDKAAWKTGETAEGLSGQRSYLILNQQNSNLLKQINMKEIPRYLLFNKKGELVHANAPGPKGDPIRALLEKYLLE